MNQQPCRFFQQGSCTKGNSCNFSHSQSQNTLTQQQPRQFAQSQQPQQQHRQNFTNQERQSYVPPTQRKQEICRKFAQSGQCKFGSQCRFSHETSQPQGQIPSQQNLDIYTPQQQNFQNNQQYNQIQQENEVEVCEYFARYGQCKQKFCKNSHKFTIQDDLQLLKFNNPQNNPNQNNPVIKFNGTTEVYSQNYLRISKISSTGQDQIIFNVTQNQNITCHFQVEQKNFLGVIFLYQITDHMKQSNIHCIEAPSLSILPAHQDVITEIFVLNLDSPHLVTTSFDGKIKFWRFQDNKWILAISVQHNSPITCCKEVNINNSQFLIIGDKQGFISVYQKDNNTFKKAFSTQVYMSPIRNLLIYEKQSVICATGNTNDVMIIDMKNFNNITQWNFDISIVAIDIAINLQEEVGSSIGQVYLVPFMESCRKYGQINLHQNSEITSIKTCKDIVNEVIRSFILIGDKSGRYSYFQFVNQKFEGLY